MNFSISALKTRAVMLGLSIAITAILLQPYGNAQADSLPDLGESSAADVPPALEREIGESQMNDIRQREPSYLNDPEIEDYLNRMAARLVAESGEADLSVRLFMLNNPSINAFAMFGGYIGVNSGLILAAQQESEVAGVVAHEIAHVSQRHLARQIAQQRQISLGSLFGVAVAILAARSNPDVANAALATSQAAGIQAQLAFSRDYEREADRIGFDMLQRADFDAQGMPSFFRRLQRAGRVYENNAPVYLRTHPLTFDRITDMEHRASQLMQPKRQRDESEFLLLQAKLAAMRGEPVDAVREFARRSGEDPNSQVIAYGYTFALFRDRQWAAAKLALSKADTASPIVRRLAAEIALGAGDRQTAERIYRDAVLLYPGRPALFYGLSDLLLSVGDFKRAQVLLDDQARLRPDDPELYSRLAKAFDGQGRIVSRHRVQAEAYFLRGQHLAAIEQLELAQHAGKTDFVEQSMIEARLRELKKRQTELAPERRK